MTGRCIAARLAAVTFVPRHPLITATIPAAAPAAAAPPELMTPSVHARDGQHVSGSFRFVSSL